MITGGILEEMFNGVGFGIYTLNKMQIMQLDLNYLMLKKGIIKCSLIP